LALRDAQNEIIIKTASLRWQAKPYSSRGEEKMKRSLYVLFALLAVFAFVLSACGPAEVPATEEPAAPVEEPVAPEPTEEPAAPTEEPAGPEIGSPERPIKVLFVPSVEANVIVTGGDVMAQALNEATGLTFEVSIPTSYAATIEEMCASPEDTMAFIPAFGYVLANDLCGVDVAFKAERRGWGVYWTMIVVARDSDIQSIEDLEGKKWAYPDAGSTSGFLVPSVMLAEAGITPGETIAAGGHPQSVRAVYNGEADFGTAFYSAWAAPEGADRWAVGMDPEVPVDVNTCALNDDASQLLCDGYRILDARANIREEFPDVVQKVRILQLSPDIPNDTLSFGPEFPAELRAQIEEALVAFAETESWEQSLGSEDFYGWSGLVPATDAEYDFIRLMVAEAGVTLESLD
jgi:phosphonate transport system substrate-binding protein